MGPYAKPWIATMHGKLLLTALVFTPLVVIHMNLANRIEFLYQCFFEIDASILDEFGDVDDLAFDEILQGILHIFVQRW